MNLSAYDLNHLRALHALLDEAHVSRAARRLGITPAAASNALRRLRAEFDDPLLVRTGRRLVRTPLGEALQGPAGQVMRAAEGVLAVRLGFDPLTYAGDVVLTAYDAIAAVLLGVLDRALADGAPQAALRLRPCRGSSLTDWLCDRGDVAIGPDPKNSLRTAPLYRDPFVCAMARSHPLADRPLTLEAYAAASHVLVAPFGKSDSSPLDRRLAARGFTRRVTRSVDRFMPVGELLRGGRHVATISASLARWLGQRDPIVTHALPLEVPVKTVNLIWHPRHDVDARHRWLRGLIIDAVAAAGIGEAAPDGHPIEADSG